MRRLEIGTQNFPLETQNTSVKLLPLKTPQDENFEKNIPHESVNIHTLESETTTRRTTNTFLFIPSKLRTAKRWWWLAISCRSRCQDL